MTGKADAFPDWHGKVRNAKAVCYWLTVKMGKTHAPPASSSVEMGETHARLAERALFGALTDVLRVLHRRPRVRLSRSERRDFYASG